MRHALLPNASPARRSQALARVHLRYHIDRLNMIFIAHRRRRSGELARFSTIERPRDRCQRLLAGLLESAEAGTFRLGDARGAARGIFVMLTDVAHWCGEGGWLSRAEVERAFGDMVMAADAERVE